MDIKNDAEVLLCLMIICIHAVVNHANPMQYISHQVENPQHPAIIQWGACIDRNFCNSEPSYYCVVDVDGGTLCDLCSFCNPKDDLYRQEMCQRWCPMFRSSHTTQRAPTSKSTKLPTSIGNLYTTQGAPTSKSPKLPTPTGETSPSSKPPVPPSLDRKVKFCFNPVFGFLACFIIIVISGLLVLQYLCYKRCMQHGPEPIYHQGEKKPLRGGQRAPDLHLQDPEQQTNYEDMDGDEVEAARDQAEVLPPPTPPRQNEESDKGGACDKSQYDTERGHNEKPYVVTNIAARDQAEVLPPPTPPKQYEDNNKGGACDKSQYDTEKGHPEKPYVVS